jgi:DNA-binding GntR family transcriptional regulator
MLGLGIQVPRRVLVVEDHSVAFARHAADVRTALERKLVRLAVFVREQLVQKTTKVIFPVRVHLF